MGGWEPGPARASLWLCSKAMGQSRYEHHSCPGPRAGWFSLAFLSVVPARILFALHWPKVLLGGFDEGLRSQRRGGKKGGLWALGHRGALVCPQPVLSCSSVSLVWSDALGDLQGEWGHCHGSVPDTLSSCVNLSKSVLVPAQPK